MGTTKAMGLKEYESKRRFGRTPEPKPALGRKGNRLVFVVQKHAAKTLHYDLRLELEGVLKSWAVPKGPSLDPSVKRLAMMVEDHPLDYKEFEGLIPEGSYGAGSVIIWDSGFYHHPAGDGKESEKLLLEGLRKGNMKFVLEGEKLQGEFALVKTGRDERSWLLMKKRDHYARKADVLKENRSVVSRRTLEEVAEAGPEKRSRTKIDLIRLREAMEGQGLEDAPAAPMPHLITPMRATLVKEPFDHPDWIFEVKWDGYRAIAEISDGNVSLYSRNLLSLNRTFAPLVDALKKLRVKALLDGEIVVVNDEGRADFQMLQHYRKSRSGHLMYYVFDLLHLEGHDLTNLPLLRRKDLLKRILPPHPTIKFSDHVLAEGLLFFNAVREKGLEGIMAKHCRSVYLAGTRSRQWLKVKRRLSQDCVIAGFTQPGGRRRHFGSLVLGVFEGDALVFIGHCGGGFGAETLTVIRKKLDPLIQEKCPFRVEPATNTPVTWVRPDLVCEVVFSGWTEDGIMRQPVFSRLREDKAAREALREEPGAIQPPRGRDCGVSPIPSDLRGR